MQEKENLEIPLTSNPNKKLCDKMLIGLFALQFLSNVGFSIIAPFFPNLAEKRGIDSDLIGLIFSINQLGGIIASLTLGKMMSFWGRKLMLGLCLIIQILSIITFGLLQYVNHKEMFLAIALFSRFLQGIGSSGYGSIVFSYFPLYYPETTREKIGQMEIFSGLGLMLGPIIGTGFYIIFGYAGTFLALALFEVFFLPFVLLLLPSEIKADPLQKKPLSLIKFLKGKHVILICFLLIFADSGISFGMPVLSGHLENHYGVNSKYVGPFFSIGVLAYALTAPFVSKIPERINRKVLLSIGSLISAISFFLVGPETLLGFPKELWIVCVGMALIGIGFAFVIIPTFPEVIYLGKKVFVREEEQEMVGDMASGIFNACFTISGILGPFCGGILAKSFGFSRGASIYGLAQLVYLVIFFILCEGVKAWKTVWVKEKKVVRLDEETTETESFYEGNVKICEKNEKREGNKKNETIQEIDLEGEETEKILN